MKRLDLATTRARGRTLHFAEQPDGWEASDTTLCGQRIWNRPAMKWDKFTPICTGCLHHLSTHGDEFGA